MQEYMQEYMIHILIYGLYLLQKWLRNSENRSATDPIGPSRHKDIIVHTSPTSIATGS